MMEIKEYGDVTIKVNTLIGMEEIDLTDVAYVPGFFANVLGLLRCKPLGINFDSGRNCLYLKHLSNVICNLEYTNSHWLIDADENDRPNISEFSVFAARSGYPKLSKKERKPI